MVELLNCWEACGGPFAGNYTYNISSVECGANHATHIKNGAHPLHVLSASNRDLWGFSALGTRKRPKRSSFVVERARPGVRRTRTPLKPPPNKDFTHTITILKHLMISPNQSPGSSGVLLLTGNRFGPRPARDPTHARPVPGAPASRRAWRASPSPARSRPRPGAYLELSKPSPPLKGPSVRSEAKSDFRKEVC